jgi:OOP family OmpA-OmpF porin
MRLFSFAALVLAALGLASAAAANDPFDRKPWVRNTIHFDPDTVTLGVVAREIINDLAADAVRAEVKKVILVGHCDTADKAPTLLSRYRAKAVADIFREKGLPATIAIEYSGVGSSQPKVKTGPNVREPYNRRVTIAF